MKYISSDTNVWIDFVTINRIALPFRLPYTYIMNQDAIDEELLSPPDFKEQLISAGLVATELTDDEFFLAESYGTRYRKLSVHDRIALAIAKKRNITLLTGDQALRNAARSEGVPLIGTIGILGSYGMLLGVLADVGVCLLTILNTLRILKKEK